MNVIEVTRPGVMRVTERDMPSPPNSHEVIVRVKAAGICGSDTHIFHGRSAFASYPRIIGHEIAGEVYQIGNSIKDLNIGDRVAVDPVISCGDCYACSIGRHNVCKTVKVLGVHEDGGYSEYLKVEAKNVFKLPDDIPWEFAATIEPYSIAAESIDRGELKSNDTVLICGAGPIGLVILQAVKRVGARVAIMDIVNSRLEKALDMGADLAIDTKKEDLLDSVMKFTDGEGASLIFEATGNIGLLETCVSKLASQAGRIIVLGFPTEKAKISPYDVMRRELDIKGSRLNRNKFPEVIEWIKKKEIDPSKIISHTFSFYEAQKAFDLIDNDPNAICKIILKF